MRTTGKFTAPELQSPTRFGLARALQTEYESKFGRHEHIKGLSLFAENDGLMQTELTEVVISNRSSIIGKTLKQVGFRALFDAAVVAIRRDGETLSAKLGDLTLQAGDFLLLATGQDFANRMPISDRGR